MPKKERELKNKFTAIKAASSKASIAIYNAWNLIKIIGSKVPYLSALSPVFGIMYRFGYIINQGIGLSFNLGANIAGAITRGLRSVFGFLAIGITIAKLVSSTIPGPIAILSDVADLIDSAWSIGLSAKSFSSGSWAKHRKTVADKAASPADILQSKNKILNKKAKLAGRIEGLAINATFLTGAVMAVFFPPLAMVGFGLLAATGAYLLLDKLNLNPFKRIGKALFGNPFKPKTSDEPAIIAADEKVSLQIENVTITPSQDNTEPTIDNAPADNEPTRKKFTAALNTHSMFAMPKAATINHEEEEKPSPPHQSHTNSI